MKLKLTLNIGKVTPAKTAPILSQAGINSLEFCKQFNHLTERYKEDTQFNVKVLVAANKTYSILLPNRSPLNSLLKKIEGNVSRKKLYEIANLNNNPKVIKDFKALLTLYPEL